MHASVSALELQFKDDEVEKKRFTHDLGQDLIEFGEDLIEKQNVAKNELGSRGGVYMSKGRCQRGQRVSHATTFRLPVR